MDCCSSTGPVALASSAPRPSDRPRLPPRWTCVRGSSCPGWSTSMRTCRRCPNAGLGAGLDLLTWLERYIFPLERGFDSDAADRLAPVVWRAFAAAGTTTAMVYGAVYEASLDATFRAAEAHGIRAVIGKVMMDRLTYDPTIDRECHPRALAPRVRESDRTLARPGRRPAALRGDARGSPSRARPTCCCESAALAASTGDVLADPRVRGSRRDRRGRAPLPGGARLRRRV